MSCSGEVTQEQSILWQIKRSSYACHYLPLEPLPKVPRQTVIKVTGVIVEKFGIKGTRMLFHGCISH